MSLTHAASSCAPPPAGLVFFCLSLSPTKAQGISFSSLRRSSIPSLASESSTDKTDLLSGFSSPVLAGPSCSASTAGGRRPETPGAPGVVLQVALQTLPSATLLTQDVRRGVVQALMKSTQTESLSPPPLPVLGNPGRKMKLV